MSIPHVPQETDLGRDHEMLLDFLRDHDAACPVCGYNLRALTIPVCPECSHGLTLTVGTTHLQLGWLLASLAPGFFSGIAAAFLSIIIIGSFIVKDPAPALIIAVDVFGWCSGFFAILLALRRMRFVALPRERQRRWAIVIWLVHAVALIVFYFIARVFY